MTPLEIMAKARWDNRADGKILHKWEDFSDASKAAHMDDMRVALLALADSSCPRELLMPHAMTARHWTMMRTIIRAIAEDGQVKLGENA